MLNGKPWQIESVLKLLLRLVACFTVGMLAVTILRSALGDAAAKESILAMALSMTATHGGALVVIGFMLREHAVSWAEAFGLRRQLGWSLVLGACSAILVLPLIWFLQATTVGWLQRLGYDFDAQEAVELLKNTREIWLRVLLGTFAIVIAPVAEEVFFRGFLYPLVKQHTSRTFALITVSVLFALIHNNVPVLPPLFVLAVILTLLYEWTGNLLASITLHALFNLANFVLMFVADKIAKAEPFYQ